MLFFHFTFQSKILSHTFQPLSNQLGRVFFLIQQAYMAKESGPGRWGPEQSARLHGLVEEGIVKSNDLSKDYILLIMRTHFPERKYSSFAPLFRKKIRNWNLNGALNGARRESVEVPSPSTVRRGRDPDDSE